jgi:hypothetical protein
LCRCSEGGDNDDARRAMAKQNDDGEGDVKKRNLRKGGVPENMVLGSDDEDSDFD